MPHCAIALSELLEELKRREERVVFLGDGVPVHRETIKEELGERAEFAPKNADRQRASSIAELALQALERGEGQDAEAFVPFYLRKSQAEREYDKKTKPEGSL
jgi:tRNA threonylcarbamoyladenosine biosynthesis protein TsaB